MQPAVFIARLIGPAFVAVGLGMLANGRFYTALILESVYSPMLIYFSGLLALVSGLAILNLHRSWTGWPVVITIIAWLMVIGGTIRLVLHRHDRDARDRPLFQAARALDRGPDRARGRRVSLLRRLPGQKQIRANETKKQTDDWNARMIFERHAPDLIRGGASFLKSDLARTTKG
jgi:hypothetical protein